MTCGSPHEIRVRDVAVQVLVRHVVIGADKRALQKSEVAIRHIRVDAEPGCFVRARVLVGAVIRAARSLPPPSGTCSPHLKTFLFPPSPPPPARRGGRSPARSASPRPAGRGRGSRAWRTPRARGRPPPW